MVQSFKLSLNFSTASGESTTLNYKYADPDVTTAHVNALVSAIITNNAIFAKVPAVCKSAKLIETDETEFTLSA